MTNFEYNDKIKRMDMYIRNECTGPALEFGKTMGTCRRTIFVNLDVLRSKGAEIGYCKIRKTYFYVKKFTLVL